jgi:hypothetical protein
VELGLPPDDEGIGDHAVFGELQDSTRVTLLKARFQSMSGFPPSVEQTLSSRHVLIGGHVTEAVPVFRAARIRIQGITALRDSLSQSLNVLRDGSTLVLGHDGEGPNLTLEFRQDASLNVIEHAFTVPVLSVVRILTSSGCELVKLDVLHGEDWLNVQSQVIGIEDRRVALKLSAFPEFGLPHLARWLEDVELLGPLPAVVAARNHDSIQLDARILELTTVAEGIHRRTQPEIRALSKDEAKKARKVILDALQREAPNAVEIARGLLGQIGKLSYRARLEALGELANGIVPGLVGNPELWASLVSGVRNEYAHRLRDEWLDEESINAHLTVVISLQWVLELILLQRTGLDKLVIARRLTRDRNYHYLHRKLTEWSPQIHDES